MGFRWLPPLALAVLLLPPALAFAAGPFEGLAGAWSGEGAVKLTNGANERLRCQANYRVTDEGEGLKQELRCKSDNYSATLEIDLTDKAGAVLGNWTETEHNLEGGVSGQASKGKIEAKVRGQAFNAAISVTTRGSQQAVVIRAENAGFSEVSITLSRGR